MPDDSPTLIRFALRTNDGLALRAEWSSPHNPRAAVVLCHPHPLHGGNMFAGIIDHLFEQLPADGIAVLRFNFRGVNGSDGAHDHGVREQFDVLAAVDEAANRAPGLPLLLVGWSFGADQALACPHPAISGWCAIAPPLRSVDTTVDPSAAHELAAANDSRPTLVITPEFDQYSAPQRADDLTKNWVATTTQVIKGVDHFLAGGHDQILQIVTRAI